MHPAPPFGRLLTAMATPFDEHGSIDLNAAARIATHLIDHGSDGLVVSGTTGESPTTTPEEHGELLAVVKDAVGGRASVISGIGTNSTAHSIELAEQAAKIGVDGLLLVTPYYNRPSQAGVLHHFHAVAATTDIPVMLYDVPARTGTRIDLATYRAAREIDTIVAVKDCTGDPAGSARLTDLGYAVYSGDEALTLGYLAYGAVGLISVVAHAAGRELHALIDSFLAGDHAEALRLHTALTPAFDAIMGVPSYGAATAKAALELLGVLDNRRVRGPLVPLDEGELAALRSGLAEAGLLT